MMAGNLTACSTDAEYSTDPKVIESLRESSRAEKVTSTKVEKTVANVSNNE